MINWTSIKVKVLLLWNTLAGCNKVQFGKKMFVNHISDNDYCLENIRTLNVNGKKIMHNLILIFSKNMKRHFTEGDTQMANRHIKICLSIKKYKWEPHLRYHNTELSVWIK